MGIAGSEFILRNGGYCTWIMVIHPLVPVLDSPNGVAIPHVYIYTGKWIYLALFNHSPLLPYVPLPAHPVYQLNTPCIYTIETNSMQQREQTIIKCHPCGPRSLLALIHMTTSMGWPRGRVYLKICIRVEARAMEDEAEELWVELCGYVRDGGRVRAWHHECIIKDWGYSEGYGTLRIKGVISWSNFVTE